MKRNKYILLEDLSDHDIDKLLNQLKNTINCECCKYFDMDTKSNYGGIINPIYYMLSKGVMHELEYISPKQYIHNIARGFGMSYEDALGSAYNDEKAIKYAEAMKNGDKFPIGYFVDGKPDQEGRHRASAAMIIGCKKIPVIKITNISSGYAKSFVETYKDYNRDELNSLFKEKGYNGISDLDWREFKNYIEYRL